MSGDTIEQFVTIRGGGTPSTTKKEYWDGDIPWVSPKDMKFDEISDAEDKISPLAIEQSATNLIPAGSCLVVVRSGILARTIPIGLTTKPVAINQDIKALCPVATLFPKYLFYTLKRYEQLLLARVTRGATVHRLATDDLKSLPMHLPSMDEQIATCQRIDKVMQEIEEVRLLTSQKLSKLTALQDAVLSSSIRSGG